MVTPPSPKAPTCDRCGDSLEPCRSYDDEGNVCEWKACECDVALSDGRSAEGNSAEGSAPLPSVQSFPPPSPKAEDDDYISPSPKIVGHIVGKFVPVGSSIEPSPKAPKSYRKKPVVIEAFQWTVDTVPQWWLERESIEVEVNTGCAIIPTLEGRMKANPKDWIIRGVKGEIYPCKPDIFEATYEQATPTPPHSEEEATMEKLLNIFDPFFGKVEYKHIARVDQYIRSLSSELERVKGELEQHKKWREEEAKAASEGDCTVCGHKQ